MILRDNTLAQLVTMKPAAAGIFENHDLDYCCRGKQTLREACHDDPLKLETIEQELEEILFYEPGAPAVNFDAMPVADLVNYIVTKHHHYVKESIPRIKTHLAKVCNKHGENYPELHQIERLFSIVSDELISHMQKEEQILFPRVMEIAECASKFPLEWTHESDYLSGPIGVMESEHESAGNIMHQIRNLTRHFIAPENACLTFKVLYQELREFENDLHRHVHLENNILFLKSLDLFNKAEHIGLN